LVVEAKTRDRKDDARHERDYAAFARPVTGEWQGIERRFDGGALSSDAGLLALREVERRLDVAGRLAAGIDDPRDPTRTVHSVADILRFRMMMITAGYEDGIDANALRADPVFKLALERLPGERDLCSQSTISRLENLPDRRMLLRMARAMVGLYCASFAQAPKRITLDIDDTFDAVHGGQQLRLFNAHYDDYGFQPIVVFDGAGRFVATVLRPARRPKGREIAAHLRRLFREIRRHWPSVEILLRGDSHYCAPEVLDFCRAQGVDFILGLASNATLRRRVATVEQATIARVDHNAGTKVRRFKQFHDAAGSWSRVERIIARVEVGPQGCDTRFPPRSPDRVSSGDRMKGLLAFHRHKPHPWQRQGALRKAVLRPRPGREPHQGVEDPPRSRSDFLHQRHRQSAEALPARRRTTADVDPARRPAASLGLAACAVRHPTPPPDQDRRPCRRAENQDRHPPADRLPGRTPHPTVAGALATHLTPRPTALPARPSADATDA
jgi:hypothetical protein